jgi:serine/threonine protein kinase
MTNLTGARLGDFEVLRELGRGGMGVVYEARQVSLNRQVALKVLSGGLGLTDKAVQRFRREAEAAARLHDTNIVPVYATGEQDGTHFYAMELIDGPSLDHVIKHMRHSSAEAPAAEERRSASLEATAPYVESGPRASSATVLGSSASGSASGDFDQVAGMVAEVADALDYAHNEGVIHRDIKPSNLLLAPDGRLSVNDFGLARLLEQPGMTMTGEFVGTPMYMSPEQITAGRAPLDRRTDIYSLGATLYELLTLQPPFAAERRDQVIAQIMHKEPRPPRKVNRRVPVDLETICLKAMEKDPDRRYQTGKEMAEDLRRYVDRFAISARRAGSWTRLTKWVKRHPAVAGLLACLFVAMLTAGFFAYQAKLGRDELRAEKRQAAVERAILEAMSGDAQAALQAINEAEDKPGQLNMLRGLVEYHSGRPKEAVVYLQQADLQLPRSVAVSALLAMAYLNIGRLELYDEMNALLEQLEPKSSEDHLFLGLYLAELAPDKAFRTLDAAPARFRQSPVARLIRAMVQTKVAQMTGSIQDAERALEDLRRVDLSDQPLFLSVRARANLVAANAYSPKDVRRDQVLSQAARDVERLALHRDNLMALEGRCFYYVVLGYDDDLLAAARQARQDRVEDGFSTDWEAMILYGRKKYDEALRVLQSTKYPGDESWLLIEQGVVLAAIP